MTVQCPPGAETVNEHGTEAHRDRTTATDARARADESPLGSGALAATPAVAEPWEEKRYPDSRIVTLDKSFEKYRQPMASLERLSQGYAWAEGPVWFGDARCLYWSDIPNNRIMRWDEETGATSIYRKPSNYANGNTRDRQGRLGVPRERLLIEIDVGAEPHGVAADDREGQRQAVPRRAQPQLPFQRLVEPPDREGCHGTPCQGGILARH